MQAFFASLTHELKTPLASVRLQSEVIKDLIQDTDEAATPYVNRLLEDVIKLENHMDKVLQLSRIERGGNLDLKKINLKEFFEVFKRETNFVLNIKYINQKNPDEDIKILADEFAMQLIFRNLIENTKNHAKKDLATIEAKNDGHHLKMTYQDGGSYEGNPEKLGTLFFKHQSSKGSGIGLYLIKKLMKKMHGEFKIENNKNLKFHLNFKLA